MLFSTFSKLALAVVSLSAVAAAQEAALLYTGLSFQGPIQLAKVGECTNLEGPPNRFFHHLGSIRIPHGVKCDFYFHPNCQPDGKPICSLSRSFTDLLSYPGPCGRVGDFGLGYGVESVYCDYSDENGNNE
ncbi:hypothetical protein VTO42DRAFT_7047 [Malbranchea cinnamomea]